MQKVEFSPDNVEKCWCPKCPVQQESACAMDQYKKAREELEQKHELSKPEEVPSLYCSKGTASCDGLKPVERCLCSECLVWGQHALVANHYCVQGTPEQLST